MAEAITIARPYAVAIYRLAKEKGTQERWSEMLAFTSAIVDDAQIQALCDNPKVLNTELERLFLAVAGDKLDAVGTSLIKLLVENKRLSILAEISSLFEQLRSQDEGVVDAQIMVAAQPDDAQIENLVAQLEARLKKKVVVNINLNPEIIGGVKIVVGDTVIDASVRGRLQEMAYTLKS